MPRAKRRARRKRPCGSGDIEMLDNPVTIVRVALDPGTKLSHLRREAKVQLLDVTTAKGDELTLAVDATTHLPASVRWLSSSDNLGDIHNETFFEDYETVSGLKLPKRYLTKIDFRNYTTADIRVSKNTVDGDAGNSSRARRRESRRAADSAVVQGESGTCSRGRVVAAKHRQSFQHPV